MKPSKPRWLTVVTYRTDKGTLGDPSKYRVLIPE